MHHYQFLLTFHGDFANKHNIAESSIQDINGTYRRWTKNSNPDEKVGMTPPSPNVNVKQCVPDMSCWRFDFFCPPVGGKVVGLNILFFPSVSSTW